MGVDADLLLTFAYGGRYGLEETRYPDPQRRGKQHLGITAAALQRMFRVAELMPGVQLRGYADVFGGEGALVQVGGGELQSVACVIVMHCIGGGVRKSGAWRRAAKERWMDAREGETPALTL